VIAAGKEDILVATEPGSPCGMPFMVIRRSPMFISALEARRAPRCDKGYILARDRDGKFTRCAAKTDNGTSFCICNGLLSSAGYNPQIEEPLYTVGARGYLVQGLVTVKELMKELKGTANSSIVPELPSRRLDLTG
jgi:nitronate monooxygenase